MQETKFLKKFKHEYKKQKWKIKLVNINVALNKKKHSRSCFHSKRN